MCTNPETHFSCKSMKDRKEYPNNLFRNARLMRDRELWDSWGELSSSTLRRQGSDCACQKKSYFPWPLNYCLQVTVHDPSGSPLLKAKHLRLANKLITGCIIDCAIKVFVWTISRVNEMVERFPPAQPSLCFFPAPLSGFRLAHIEPKRDQAASCCRNSLAAL